MPPETPRSNAKTGYSLTPSFTFNLGLLPSFRFGSPQNLSLLTSLSPHRILNRFSRSKDVNGPTSNTTELQSEAAPPVKEVVPSIELPKQTKLMDSFPEPYMELNASDLVCTAESVDLWSLANDTRNSANITSIHEDSTKEDFYFSPAEFFVDSAINLNSSPSIEEKSTETPTRKRASSCVDRSPCQVLASQIDNSGSPITPSAKKTDSSKVWTPGLDDVLLQCHDKYKRFRANNSPDALVFRHTSQNKILSRMLFNRTGAKRTAKQISSRLFRLNKSQPSKTSSSPSVSVSSQPPMEKPSIMVSSPVTQTIEGSSPTTNLCVKDFVLAFNYKQRLEKTHIFTKLHDSLKLQDSSTFDSIAKEAGVDTALFHKDFDFVVEKLSSQHVPIYNITAMMNMKPSENVTSTPTSPLTNPCLFSLDNGNFLTFMKISVCGKNIADLFLSWKSSITIYRGDQARLLKSTECVNGYKNNEGNFDLEVPFLNNFWSGYLTYLSNGSQAYDDLKTLRIVQVIYDGDNESTSSIHGFFTYSFDISNDGSGIASVKKSTLKRSEESHSEMDDNATVLASSSPVKTSPSRFNLSIDTNLANRSISPGPLSVPTYDANVLHKHNPNYAQAQTRPLLSRFKSMPDHGYMKSPFETYTDACSNYSTMGPMSNPPAGQAGLTQPPNTAPNVEVLHTPQSMQFSRASAASEMGQYHVAPAPLQYTASPAPVGPPGVGFPPNPNMVPPTWQAVQQQMIPMLPVQAASAPASQVHFPFAPEEPNNTKDAGRTTITFGPILEYDPSKDQRSQVKRTKGNPSMHKFQLNRQIMYKPKK